MSDALPVTPDEIARESIAAAEAGAAIIHLHARDPKTGAPTPDPNVFMQFLPRIKQSTKAIVNISTGGALGMSMDDRIAAAAPAEPEITSLNMGSMNFAIFNLAKRYDKWKHDWEKPYLERLGLAAGACHYDALTEQRQALEPVELIAQPHDFADYDRRRRLHVVLVDQPGQRGQRPHQRVLIGPRPPAHGHGGRIGGAAVGDQRTRDFIEGEDAHEDDQRLRPANLAPIDARCIVARHERHHLGVFAMRERYSRVRRNSQRRRDPRHNFESHVRGGQRFGFFPTAAENERIAAFQPHDVQAPPRALDHHGADLFLAEGVHGGA